MKVYTKKEERNSKIPGIIVMSVFLCFSIWIFYTIIASELPLLEAIIKSIVIFVFALIFFGFGFYFLIHLLKGPVGYRVKLIKKENQKYNNMYITYMVFKVVEDNNDDGSEYSCYTKEDNHLEEGMQYTLYLKEFNWEPKYLSEIQGDNIKTKSPEMNISITILAVAIVVGTLALASLIGLILYPKYWYIYLIAVLSFSYAFYNVIQIYKASKHEHIKISNRKIDDDENQ